MISRFRIKFDVVAQLILSVVAIVLICTARSQTTTIIVLLALWQIGSALHLLYAYQYVQKVNFLRTALVLAISMPVWLRLVGELAWLAVAGLAIWYLWQSIQDWRIVNRRPRSFWDL